MRFVTRAPRSLFLLVGGAMAVWLATLSPRVPGLPIADAASLSQTAPQPAASAGRPLKVLFLGQDQATHSAAGIYQSIGAPLARKGIQLTPVLSPAALTAERLRYYDAIIIYGNHTTLAPDQEKALLDFVESGKGVVALHSASEMFGGSEALHHAHRRAVAAPGRRRRVHRRDRPVVAPRGAGRAAVCDVG